MQVLKTKTEAEIISHWQGALQSPRVSICCITFNHEQFISEALESFLNQKTDFPFEILVHDDASTDRTAEIIQEYQEKYPNLIKPLLQTKNQYSKGLMPNASFNYPRAKGDYMALCEGDDFWTDEKKIQKQFEALETHPKINICFHYAALLNMQTGIIERQIGKYQVSDKFPVISFVDIILNKYGQIPTGSTFFRKSLIPKLDLFFKSNQVTVGDIYTFMLGSEDNGAYLIKESMSVYRVNVSSAWTSTLSNEKLISHMENRQAAFKSLESIFDKKYTPVLRESVLLGYLGMLKSPFLAIEVKKRIYKNIESSVSFMRKIQALALIRFNIFNLLIIKLRKLKHNLIRL